MSKGTRKRGRPPKSAALRIADGTHRNDRHGAPSSQFEPAGAVEKPAFENVDASTLWDSTVTKLLDAGVAKSTDVAVLQSMCELWGLYRSALRVADADPTSPAARTAVTAYFAKFEVAASRCGLNPTDRSRLRVDSKPQGGVERRG